MNKLRDFEYLSAKPLLDNPDIYIVKNAVICDNDFRIVTHIAKHEAIQDLVRRIQRL